MKINIPLLSYLQYVCCLFYGEMIETKVFGKGLEITHTKFQCKILNGSKVMNNEMHVSFSLWHTVQRGYSTLRVLITNARIFILKKMLHCTRLLKRYTLIQWWARSASYSQSTALRPQFWCHQRWWTQKKYYSSWN